MKRIWSALKWLFGGEAPPIKADAAAYGRAAQVSGYKKRKR